MHGVGRQIARYKSTMAEWRSCDYGKVKLFQFKIQTGNVALLGCFLVDSIAARALFGMHLVEDKNLPLSYM